jgi:hypothetical protein
MFRPVESAVIRQIYFVCITDESSILAFFSDCFLQTPAMLAVVVQINALSFLNSQSDTP